jgi:hypothetical protein
VGFNTGWDNVLIPRSVSGITAISDFIPNQSTLGKHIIYGITARNSFGSSQRFSSSISIN